MICVDTGVWSNAFRKKGPGEQSQASRLLFNLVKRHDAIFIPGYALQELLSGVKTNTQFRYLKDAVEPFPVVLATVADHLLAAEIYNLCKGRGINVFTADCLIAAMCISGQHTLLTCDKDFLLISSCTALSVEVIQQ